MNDRRAGHVLLVRQLPLLFGLGGDVVRHIVDPTMPEHHVGCIDIAKRTIQQESGCRRSPCEHSRRSGCVLVVRARHIEERDRKAENCSDSICFSSHPRRPMFQWGCLHDYKTEDSRWTVDLLVEKTGGIQQTASVVHALDSVGDQGHETMVGLFKGSVIMRLLWRSPLLLLHVRTPVFWFLVCPHIRLTCRTVHCS
jgi:hypothetical protein